MTLAGRLITKMGLEPPLSPAFTGDSPKASAYGEVARLMINVPSGRNRLTSGLFAPSSYITCAPVYQLEKENLATTAAQLA
jgi:hypothetical protein